MFPTLYIHQPEIPEWSITPDVKDDDPGFHIEFPLGDEPGMLENIRFKSTRATAGWLSMDPVTGAQWRAALAFRLVDSRAREAQKRLQGLAGPINKDPRHAVSFDDFSHRVDFCKVLNAIYRSRAYHMVEENPFGIATLQHLEDAQNEWLDTPFSHAESFEKALWLTGTPCRLSRRVLKNIAQGEKMAEAVLSSGFLK